MLQISLSWAIKVSVHILYRRGTRLRHGRYEDIVGILQQSLCPSRGLFHVWRAPRAFLVLFGSDYLSVVVHITVFNLKENTDNGEKETRKKTLEGCNSQGLWRIGCCLP